MAWSAKSIGQLDFGLRIADFGFWGFGFQSAFRNLHSAIKEARPAPAPVSYWTLRSFQERILVRLLKAGGLKFTLAVTASMPAPPLVVT
jgi:hypothetical protein